MITCAEKDVVDGAQLEADVIIVGSGAAGIPTALTLDKAGFSVLLLEAGIDKLDDEHQSVYSGTVSDEKLHSPPDTYRQRRLGGSTPIWGGRCVPFDPIDFKQRAYVEHSGWPITPEELQPYYERANQWLEAGACDYDGRTALPSNTPTLIKGFESDIINTEGLERFSRPTDLYQRYKKRLQISSRLRLLYDASCVGIRVNEAENKVQFLDVSTQSGKRFKVKGKKYIMATGGIEIPRLLLASNDVNPAGVGNAHGNVGRYYQCHIAGNVGKLKFKGSPENIRHSYEISDEGIYCRRRISLRADEQERLQANNVVLRLHIPKIVDPAHKSGILSGLFLARFFISYEYAVRLNDGDKQSAISYLKHFLNIVTTPFQTLTFLYQWVTKRTLAARRFPSVILPNSSNIFSLEVNAEQCPNPDSRITLIDEKDKFGMPKVNIDWRYLEQDVVSVQRTVDAFAKELERTQLGSLEVDSESFEQELMRFGAYGGHHVGTTRMGDDPVTSVVNKHCQVHGYDDLYIASSSVFPTSSQANPTLTLLAFALRITDHVAENMNGHIQDGASSL